MENTLLKIAKYYPSRMQTEIVPIRLHAAIENSLQFDQGIGYPITMIQPGRGHRFKGFSCGLH